MLVFNEAKTHFATCGLRFVRVSVPVDPLQPEGEQRTVSMLQQLWHPCDGAAHAPEWADVAAIREG